jgi:hypothetical protein
MDLSAFSSLKLDLRPIIWHQNLAAAMNLFEKPRGVQTRWSSFENPSAGRNCAGLENQGAKGHASDRLRPGETKTLLDVTGSGMITRIWCTIMERGPEMLRGLRLDIFWDQAERPAVSCPVGDFFGIGLGRMTAFESALFSDPEGRSFLCFVPMPFRKAARVTITNETGVSLSHLFYDIDLLVDIDHSPETLYFHAHWRRESPNELGKEFTILPRVCGNGRFLGCNVGVIAAPIYGKTWWGEGEVKVWFGDDKNPTLCGTGTEDYIGTAWGQGSFAHRTQGCPIADEEKRQWAFYRYHVDDPIFFDEGCKVSIQTIGGNDKMEIIRLKGLGAPIIPVTIDPHDRSDLVRLADVEPPVDLQSRTLPAGWCNFWRQDDWSGTAYFYLDAPENELPNLAPAAERMAGLSSAENAQPPP